MPKVQRYFHKEEAAATPKDEKLIKEPLKAKAKLSSNETITHNVEVKPNVWGRRRNDTKKIVKKIPNPYAKYPGRMLIPKEKLEKHSRGEGITGKGIKTGINKKRFKHKEDIIKFTNEQAARVEILLTEESGDLEAEPGETTTQFTQRQIVENVDITAATKHFELRLNDFGPYRVKYTRNGRHLLLGGRRGHVAALDWMTKKLHCEMNVMESVHDVSWLHIETMFAVAQKDWVYMYDNQGIELHCLKRLNKVSRMEFLPYHFLLATANEEGFLAWLDISIGELVGRFNTKLGRLNILTQNPYNAVLCVGHAKGVVSMWTPTVREPVAKLLCHKAPLSALHIDPKGMYMATAAADRSLKIWDIRKLQEPMQVYNLKSIANNVAFSQKNMLAVGMGNLVEVYRDCCVTSAKRPYLRHRLDNAVENFAFCPFEDVLGVASARGFTSLLVPGCGEPNFDALELNPYQTKSQRREAEVKALLEKIQPELITLDPSVIAEVDVPSLRDKIEAKKKLLYLKPPKVNYDPRRKGKGKGGSVKIAKNKKIVQENAKMEFVKTVNQLQKKKQKTTTETNAPYNVLDRFKAKKK